VHRHPCLRHRIRLFQRALKSRAAPGVRPSRPERRVSHHHPHPHRRATRPRVVGGERSHQICLHRRRRGVRWVLPSRHDQPLGHISGPPRRSSEPSSRADPRRVQEACGNNFRSDFIHPDTTAGQSQLTTPRPGVGKVRGDAHPIRIRADQRAVLSTQNTSSGPATASGGAISDHITMEFSLLPRTPSRPRSTPPRRPWLLSTWSQVRVLPGALFAPDLR